MNTEEESFVAAGSSIDNHVIMKPHYPFLFQKHLLSPTTSPTESPADAFFNSNMDADPTALPPFSSNRLKRQSLSQRSASALRSSLANAAPSSHPAHPSSRRRSQRFIPTAITNKSTLPPMHQDENGEENMRTNDAMSTLSPATRTRGAVKRESNRFPSVVFNPPSSIGTTHGPSSILQCGHAQRRDSLSSPLPGPKGAVVTAAPALPRAMFASDGSYPSATTTTHGIGDLSALQSAVRALKNTSLSSSVPPPALPDTGTNPPTTLSYSRPECRPAMQMAPLTSAAPLSLDEIQQRMASISMTMMKKKAAHSSDGGPKVYERRSVETKQQKDEEKKIPGPCVSPLPSDQANVQPPNTVYDGDDVVMGDAPPPTVGGGDSGSCDQDTQQLQQLPQKITSSTTDDSTTRVSSRFRIEALRQGVTPLRVRERRASQSPSFQNGASVVGAPPYNATTNSMAPGVASNRTQPPLQENANSNKVHENPLGHSHGAVDTQTDIHVSAEKESSSISNNPLFAGTPSHPTPPSVTAHRRPSLSMVHDHQQYHVGSGVQGTRENRVRTPSTGGSAAASEGMKLVEQLHAVAEQLQGQPTPTTVGPTKPNPSPLAFPVPDSVSKFQSDVQALLQALDAATPVAVKTEAAGRGRKEGTQDTTVRELAAASTEERPKAVARRRHSSSLSPTNDGAPLLDLNKFDDNGDRRLGSLQTPIHNYSNKNALEMTTTGATDGSGGGNTYIRRTHSAQKEVETLRHQVASMEAERVNATALLAEYQGTIGALQEKYSSQQVKLQSENALLKNESQRLRKERNEINQKFETLHRDKYVPLKNENVALHRGMDALRNRLLQEGDKVKRIAQLEAELSAARAATTAAQQSAAAYNAEVEAAREAERVLQKRVAEATSAVQEAEKRWAAKFAAEATRAEQALASKATELSQWKDKHAAMARQHDEAVHRAHMVQAAKERLQAEVGRKEEEICAMEVRMKEVENVLVQYRAENKKFAAVKEEYKRIIAQREDEVMALQHEKNTLASMCNELLSRLEGQQ